MRLIGAIEAEQMGDGHKVIGVGVHSSVHEEVHSLSEVPKPVLDQVDEFFVSYNKSRGKKFKIRGRHGPKRVSAVLDLAVAAFLKKEMKKAADFSSPAHIVRPRAIAGQG